MLSLETYTKADVDAASEFYGARKTALWTTPSGWTAGAKALATEIGEAQRWGLDAKDYALPDMSAAPATPDAAGTADAQFTMAALRLCA